MTIQAKYSSETADWLRPKTVCRYIHPPMAERMYTLWPEGKIILGINNTYIDFVGYRKLECSGLWLVHGENDEPFDFRCAKNTVPTDGTPIHGLSFQKNGFHIHLETFCSIGQKPICFIRLRLTGTGESLTDEPFALLLRSGREHRLVFGSPDGYISYAPDISVWKNSPSTWLSAKDSTLTLLRDDDVFLSADGSVPLHFDEKAGTLRFSVPPRSGKTTELLLAFGKGEALPFDYEQEKRRAAAFWKRELARIDRLPESIADDPEKLRMVQNLTIHILQCFARSAETGNMLPRQGGLQRLVWPWECMPVLEALSRIGDFADYVEPALSLYFDVFQGPDGEIRPHTAINWANITASALYSFAIYCKCNSKRFYHLYRDNAMAAFDWIKRIRASSSVTKGCIPGLFPPMRSNDWKQIFQRWSGTDVTNVEGLMAFADTAEFFHDPRALEIREEAQDYLNTMRGLMKKFEEEAGESDQLRVPITPDGNDEQLLREFYPNFHFGKMTKTGVVRAADVPRVKNYIAARGIYGEKELYGHMPYRDGNTHIWYTTNPDYDWFLTWLHLGRRDLAEKILESQIAYSMTDEYYTMERYADNDPYYMPWSPNASGNGRILIMLLDLARK